MAAAESPNASSGPSPPRFRSYRASDQWPCLALFDASCPEYFDPSERADYQQFLANDTAEYQVCLRDDRVVGAYGVYPLLPDRCAVRWILTAPDVQGQGVGSAMMAHGLDRARSIGARRLKIAASHKSAPFFARFGARATETTENGWGPGLHRVDMELVL